MSKKVLFLLSLLLFTLLAGCNAEPDYQVKFTKELYFQKETEMPFEVKVTDEGKVVTGLEVSVDFTMTSMDHGTYKAKLVEGAKGTYSGKAALPMTGKYEAAFTLEKDGKKTEKVIQIKVTNPKGVANINGKWITNEEVAFYQLINQLQLEINRETAKQKYSGKQLEEELSYLETQEKASDTKGQLLTQIIRLRSMALLAQEKGHKVTDAEITATVNKVREQYNQYEGVKKLISEYGENKFWATEREQSKLIVLTGKVQKDIMDQVRKENPTAGQQELDYQAQTTYEDLLISQVNTLEIEIL